MLYLFGFFALVLLAVLIRRTKAPEGASVSAAEFRERLLGEPKPLLLDVRTSLEFKQAHLPGARHLPLQELQARRDELEPGRPILLYCRSGHRSAMALHSLRGMGFQNLKDLAGGILAWQDAGFPVEK